MVRRHRPDRRTGAQGRCNAVHFTSGARTAWHKHANGQLLHCFEVMLVRLSTGSWEDAERRCGSKVSDTTVRERRDDWVATGVFDAIATEALGAYDRVVGLDLSDVGLSDEVGRPGRR